MEGSSSVASGGGKTAGSRSKTPGIPPSTRLQRNLAEKERRDKLNGFISELATLVPMVSNASKPLDKVSILRLAAAEMRLHFSCLNPKKYKNKPLVLPPAITASLDLIEKTIGGFIIVTTLTGLIVFCSRSIEDYLGYQNIDVMGNKVMKYIYEDDVKYFESKVNSVVNSLKKSNKKKSKVIKAHMLQKPLPRSNESIRPRNMIFKISVYQNDVSENGTNGSSNPSSSVLKKTRPPRDFGYSAVVLMFIEPVRLEPEIDITYIDSNQDVYFTRHGLQGEIIYADQRISSITGYMPHDVQGTSAYQYICHSDVPIALFAQKAMFTSPDGKGVIVYRLRISDMRFIYLQSSGQIAYKEASNEISHFVCFNRLLSEEEGSQELKKFQQRYAPQIMAAKMLQVKQNAGGQSPTTDLAYEQVMTLMNPSMLADVTSPVAQINSFQCSKASSPEVPSGANDQKSAESFVSPSNSSMASSSVHSSEGHSITSPISNHRSSSVTSDYSGYVNDQQIGILMERPEQRDGGGPLRRTDCTTFSASPYEMVISARKEKSFGSEQLGSSVTELDHTVVVNKSCHPESSVNTDESYRIQQNDQCVSIKSQIKNMHSVNAYSSFQNGISVKGSEGTLSDHPMNLLFDRTLLQKNTSFNLTTSIPDVSNSYAGQSDGLISGVNGPQSEYVRYNGQASKENHHFVTTQNDLLLPGTRTAASNVLRDQQLNFNGEQILRNRLSHSQDSPSFSEVYEVSPLSSLSKTSDLSDAVDYCPSVSSYHENGSYSNSYSPSNVSSYNNGANTSVYNGLDIPDCKTFSVNPYEVNGFHVPVTSMKGLSCVSAMDIFDSANTSVEMPAMSQIPQVDKKVDFTDDFPETINIKRPMSAYQNGTSDAYSTTAGCDVAAPVDWTDAHSDPTGSVDLALNKELYRELDLFFQNLPQSNASQSSGIKEPVSVFPVDNSSYPQNSISSSRAKINYHQ